MRETIDDAEGGYKYLASSEACHKANADLPVEAERFNDGFEQVADLARVTMLEV